MLLPIQYALTYPNRQPMRKASFDFRRHSAMTFEPIDKEAFVCFALAEYALKEGKSYPCVLNAAGEALVERFLTGSIRWTDIGRHLERIIASHTPVDLVSLEAILDIDKAARAKAHD
jgi:1-deoxy-D-xylulose-5-phosphate reductoisomerase